MIPKPLTPAHSLDLAYRRQKPTRTQLDIFEAGRAALVSAIHHAVTQNETEEYVKNLVVRFLGTTNFSSYDVNVRQKRDLVIRTGARPQDPVGVILELKRPQSAAEMVTTMNLNRRAFHELLYYYLQDRDKRADTDSKSLKRLVITNGLEWFVFDALDFDRLFWSNSELKRQFHEFERKAASSSKTSFFYNDIAAPFLAALAAEVPFTYFDLAAKPTVERDQILLYKLLSPPHLLKEPFAQDANTLNRAFYEELLYLIGLEEVKEKGRKLIQRCAPERRQPGSLLENAVLILDSENELINLNAAEASAYGTTREERLVGVALELCLTWINRLLFLKLLEGQLRRYHPGHDGRFRFLTPELIPEYDTLNKLFFRVLNTPAADRKEPVKSQYSHIPYLNSSLYEPSLLENKTIKVSALEDHLDLPLHRKSVLRSSGPAPQALAYLLRFLDAYDFASEGEEQVQEEGKALISAAVLGLIFEKLNGYKDGSFYTPGFITMYICRQTLRRAVVQHFNKEYGFGVDTIDQLADALDGKQRPVYSQHFNQLTVCDPAVGSGHFLVSALNELLAIKSELSLLLDDEGRRLRYSLVVARDELVVKDEDERLVQYRATLAPDGSRTVPVEHTRLQSTLFREKRHLMEHALFGVDLNPNSVRICRLRLWIELLKHAYYRPDTQFQELETLPNLDLNIKAGNSLLSRFPLDADLSDVFKQGKFSLKTYRAAVHEYFGSRGREAKEELQGFLTEIKDQFSATIYRGDPLRREILALKSDLLRVKLDAAPDMYGQARLSEDEAWEKASVSRLKLEKAEDKLAQREQGTLFREAFEWRFEFPEILNDKGQFRGFDVVVGNPPYIRQEELTPTFKKHLKGNFVTGAGTADLYVYFYELGLNLLAPNGEVSFITNNKWLRANYGQALRRHLLAPSRQLLELLDFGDLPVFPEAATYPNILSVRRAPAGPTVRVAELSSFDTDVVRFTELVNASAAEVPKDQLTEASWSISGIESQQIISKITLAGNTLDNYINGTSFNGIKSALGAAFVIDETTRNALILADPACNEIIKPFLIGRDIKRYLQPKTDDYILLIDWNFSLDKYPSIKQHLLQFEAELKNRSEVKSGNHPWFALERPRTEAKSAFSAPKIIYNAFQVRSAFTFDNGSHFSNNATYIIPSADLFLLGCLNSKAVWFQITQLCIAIRGGYQLLFNNFKKVIIPFATPEQQAEIATLVEQVLAAKAANAAVNTTALEQQIDLLVASLYGLTPTEQLLLTV